MMALISEGKDCILKSPFKLLSLPSVSIGQFSLLIRAMS